MRSAASYFDPTNPEDISEKILELSNDKSFYNSLIERGKRRLKDLESPKSKAVKYIDLINKIYLLKNKLCVELLDILEKIVPFLRRKYP